MKITNLDKGKAYQLGENAKLEVERTNPFFNDYGETTSPLDIPASDYNRMILNYPDTFGMRDKMVATNVSIEDGEYFAQCRQMFSRHSTRETSPLHSISTTDPSTRRYRM